MLLESDDLVTAAKVAVIIGLGNPKGVGVYARRYEDFPAPVISEGKCVMWLRPEVEAWAQAHGR